MKCVCGIGLLNVFMINNIEFIIESMRLILLLKFVCFGVFMILMW